MLSCPNNPLLILIFQTATIVSTRLPEQGTGWRCWHYSAAPTPWRSMSLRRRRFSLPSVLQSSSPSAMGHATHVRTSPWVTVTFILTICMVGSWAQTVLPIVAKGSKFFDSSGKQFYIRGISPRAPLSTHLLTIEIRDNIW